jgi:metallo-beta-lactamase class B
LILSHGHADHYGGATYVQEKFHPRIYLSAVDWDYAQTHKRRPDQGPPPAKDLVVNDGDTISLGDEHIKVYITPGHTPGSLAMLIPVKDHGRPRVLAYFGGITSKGLTPELHAAYDRSFARMIRVMGAAKVDGYIAAHPNYDDAVYKNEKNLANPTEPNAFLVGTVDTVRFLQIDKECNLNNAQIEARRGAQGGAQGE